MAEVRQIEPGLGRTILVVIAHADDLALFIGGTVASWTDAGWRVVVVRVTDDRWDSVGLDEASTVAANHSELRRAASLLGVREDDIVEFGWATDRLADESEVALRELIIRAIRVHRPYALVTFDPFSMYGEDNMDHKVVAAATDEAFWTAQFDKHHPEHLAAGLRPHGCFERWYFGRRVMDVTHVVDTTRTLDRKVAAARAHTTMMLNFANQLQLQAATGGWRLAIVDEATKGGDPGPLLETMLRAGSARTGSRYGLGAAEEFRIVTFGGMSDWLASAGERM